jgi:hypothetical protein
MTVTSVFESVSPLTVLSPEQDDQPAFKPVARLFKASANPDLQTWLDGGYTLIDEPADYPGPAGFANERGIINISSWRGQKKPEDLIAWQWTDKEGKTQKRVAVRQVDGKLFERIEKDIKFLDDRFFLATEDFKLPDRDKIINIVQEEPGVIGITWRLSENSISKATIDKSFSPKLYEKAAGLFLEVGGGLQFDRWGGVEQPEADAVAGALKELQAEDPKLAARLAQRLKEGGSFAVKDGNEVPGDTINTISFANGTTLLEVPKDLFKDKTRLKTELKTALKTLPPLPEKIDVSKVLGDPAIKASDLIDTLVRRGNVAFSSFEGKLLRERVVEALDRSPFLKWCFTQHMKKKLADEPLHTFVFSTVNGEVEDALGTASGSEDYAGLTGGSVERVRIWKEPLKDRDHALAIVAHEIFHRAPGLGHHADMDLAMAVFSEEAGLPRKDSVGMQDQGIIPDDFSYELFAAAVGDFREAGATDGGPRSRWDEDLDHEKAKKGLDKIFGPGHGMNIHQAISYASQGWPGDGTGAVSRDEFVGLVQAYLHALDGGEVEKIHAAQLKRMGFADPEKLKRIAQEYGADNKFGNDDYNRLRGLVEDYLSDDASSENRRKVRLRLEDYGVDVNNLLPLMNTLEITDTRRHEGLQRRDGESTKDHYERLLNTLAVHYADGIHLENRTVPPLTRGSLSYEAVELLMTYIMVNAPDRATMSSDDLAESAIDEILERVWNAYKNKYEGHRNKGKWREGQGILRNYFNREDRKGYKAIRDLARSVHDRVRQAPA